MELKEKVRADQLRNSLQPDPHQAKESEPAPKKRGRPPKVKVHDDEGEGNGDE